MSDEEDEAEYEDYDHCARCRTLNPRRCVKCGSCLVCDGDVSNRRCRACRETPDE